MDVLCVFVAFLVLLTTYPSWSFFLFSPSPVLAHFPIPPTTLRLTLYQVKLLPTTSDVEGCGQTFILSSNYLSVFLFIYVLLSTSYHFFRCLGRFTFLLQLQTVWKLLFGCLFVSYLECLSCQGRSMLPINHLWFGSLAYLLGHR